MPITTKNVCFSLVSLFWGVVISLFKGVVISNRIHDDNNDDDSFGAWTLQVVNMTIMMTIKPKGRGHLK